MAPDQEHDVTMTMIRIRVQEVRQRTKSRRRLVAGTIGAAAVVSGVILADRALPIGRSAAADRRHAMDG